MRLHASWAGGDGESRSKYTCNLDRYEGTRTGSRKLFEVFVEVDPHGIRDRRHVGVSINSQYG
jgi:hypothetical protein